MLEVYKKQLTRLVMNEVTSELQTYDIDREGALQWYGATMIGSSTSSS